LSIAARANQLTAPAIAHAINSEHHPDCYYLKSNGERIKHVEKPKYRISEQTRQRAVKAQQRRQFFQELNAIP